MGTPTYMSPEQAMGERDIDGRSDIYSLGVIGYQMLTGRVPFAAANPMALLLKHVGERPRPIVELRSEAPEPLRAAIERALSKEPEDRWPTAAALRDALQPGAAPASPWRSEQREPLRYTSPRPPPAPPAPPAANSIALEPAHLAALTGEQRDDLRLWHGRIHLLDRIKAMRGYALLTLGSIGLGVLGFAVGVMEAPPLVLSPIVPAYMSIKLWRRGKSLRRSGLSLRRVLLMPRAHWALPAGRPPVVDKELLKLVPREVLAGAEGAALRQAAVDRAAILQMVADLSKADRALLPDLTPTVKALLERVAHLAQLLHRLDQETDPRLAHQLAAQRSALGRQLGSAGLALQNIRLDLIKLQSSGLKSALSDVTSATQQARALSRDIAAALEAVDEMKAL